MNLYFFHFYIISLLKKLKINSMKSFKELEFYLKGPQSKQNKLNYFNFSKLNLIINFIYHLNGKVIRQR